MEDLVTRYRKQEQLEVVDAAREEGIEIGVERGIGIGEERGIVKGREENKREIALRLSQKGFSLEQIAEFVDSEPVVVDSWLAELE